MFLLFKKKGKKSTFFYIWKRSPAQLKLIFSISSLMRIYSYNDTFYIYTHTHTHTHTHIYKSS